MVFRIGKINLIEFREKFRVDIGGGGGLWWLFNSEAGSRGGGSRLLSPPPAAAMVAQLLLSSEWRWLRNPKYTTVIWVFRSSIVLRTNRETLTRPNNCQFGQWKLRKKNVWRPNKHAKASGSYARKMSRVLMNMLKPVMASTVTSTNNLSLRSILEKDKLTGPNFLDWERNLMIVLRHERKWYVLQEPLGEAPPANAPAAARNAHKKHSDDLLDVACLMLATMSPDLQAGLINTNAYDMIRQLRDMFQTQARTERYDATKAFNECKMIKGTSLRTLWPPCYGVAVARTKYPAVLMISNQIPQHGKHMRTKTDLTIWELGHFYSGRYNTEIIRRVVASSLAWGLNADAQGTTRDLLTNRCRSRNCHQRHTVTTSDSSINRPPSSPWSYGTGDDSSSKYATTVATRRLSQNNHRHCCLHSARGSRRPSPSITVAGDRVAPATTIAINDHRRRTRGRQATNHRGQRRRLSTRLVIKNRRPPPRWWFDRRTATVTRRFSTTVGWGLGLTGSDDVSRRHRRRRMMTAVVPCRHRHKHHHHHQLATTTELVVTPTIQPQSGHSRMRYTQPLRRNRVAIKGLTRFSGSRVKNPTEFAYNNSLHSCIGMAPFEPLYGRKCRTPTCWLEAGEKQFAGPEIIQETADKKCLAEEESVIPISEIRVDTGNRCIEEPEAILESKTKKLRHKEVTMVKVQWKHHRGANVTWEAEEDMKRRYPQLFAGSNYESNGPFGIEIGALTKKLWPKQNSTKNIQMLAIASYTPSDRLGSIVRLLFFLPISLATAR
ncbi:hypothetical protein OSB04_031693 [Centaurea solstitialis]|uniref:Uncharacterized protein n=1 Tax=Centaurea solstitialis TaxID=347529 RepID=A0AA38SMM0_9ASTR|nr:hypothetical protein OSB04_031693 [Centaurea solstitialis]